MAAAYRAVAVIVCALALAGCMTRDPFVSSGQRIDVGAWRLEKTIDRVTNAPISSATVATRVVDNSNIQFAPAALLQLFCFKGSPAVRIGFQFKVGSTRNAQFGYVFDKNPGHEPVVRFTDTYRDVVIENGEDVATFARELAQAKSLYVRIRSLNAGRTSAEFAVDGAGDIVANVYATCPLEKGPASPAAASKGSRRAATVPQPAATPVAEPEDDGEIARQPVQADDDMAFNTEEEKAIRRLFGWTGR